MPVKVQSIIEPYNDSYKVVNAKNVGVNEKSLDEVLDDLQDQIDSMGEHEESNPSYSMTIDSELSLTSENPVQNKVITQEFKAFNEAVGEINERVSSLESGGGGGGSGGVSSWNDLTDKPFDEVVVFDGVLQDVRVGDTDWMHEPSAEDTSDAALVVGQTYIYTWGGKEYTSVCFSTEGLNCIGNNAPVTGVDNGQPVVIFRSTDKWDSVVIKDFNDTDGTYPLKVTELKQLDNKYLSILDRQVGSETDYLPSYTGTNMFLELSFGISAFMLVPVTTKEVYDAWMANQGNVTVVYDNVTYDCPVQEIQGMKVVGNLTSMGGTGNNEPFAAVVTPEDGGYIWIIMSTVDTAPTEHTVRVCWDAPERWVLKEEYLPFDAIAAYIDSYIDEALGGDY